jgi:transcriptional regulator with XRE-family HTH domain
VKSKAFTSLLSRLRALRKAHNLTQEGFAEMAGMSYKYYQAVEGGRKAELRFSTLEKLAAAYGIELWELLAPPMPKVCLTAAPKRKRAPKAQPPQGRERRKRHP